MARSAVQEMTEGGGFARIAARYAALAVTAGMCTLLLPTRAFAASAPLCGAASTPATLCPPSAEQPSAVATLNADGTVTVTTQGEYTWLTPGFAQTDAVRPGDRCGGVYGIGWAMAWNDPEDPAAVTLSAAGVSEGVGSAANALNPPDASVRYDATDPCGTPQNWGPAMHRYASIADLPPTICVNLYALRQPQGAAAVNDALNQPDNSITAGRFEPAPGGGFCVAPELSLPAAVPTGAPASPQPVLRPGSLAGDIVALPQDGAGTATAHAVASQPDPPGLRVDESVSPAGSVPAGAVLTYTVKVQNTSTRATTPARLTDLLTLPSGATATVSGAPSASIGTVIGPASGTMLSAPGASWTWDLSGVSLSPGAAATLTIAVKAMSAGALTDKVTLAGSDCPPAGAVARCSRTSQVVELILSKTVDQQHDVAFGTRLVYTISLQNPASQAAQDVVMSDVMSGTATGAVDRASFQASSNAAIANNNVSCTESGCGAFTWTWLAIPGDATARLTYSAAIEPTASGQRAATLTNTASSAGLPPASVSTTALPSGVQAATTQPGTSGLTTGAAAALNLRLAAALVLGGAGLFALGLVKRGRAARDI